jgi:hypothetical protein
MTTKSTLRFPLLLLTTLLLASCNFPAPELARPEQPLYVPPLGLTATPLPTLTPNPAAWIGLGAEQIVPAGGYAFVPLAAIDESMMPLSLEIDGSQATQVDAKETLFFSLANEPSGESVDVSECLQEILNRLPADITNFTSSTPQPISAAGLEGLQADISGSLFGEPMLGSLAVLHPDGRCFSLVGMAATAEASSLWQSTGKLAFDALLKHVRFLPNLAACQIATDPTYGLSPENPIRLGSVNLYDGITRMEAYLNTLRGPNFEEISYTRLDPMYNQGDQIVDPYEISYVGLSKPLTLYFDLYTYEPPMAPVGFTCEAAFPLQQP